MSYLTVVRAAPLAAAAASLALAPSAAPALAPADALAATVHASPRAHASAATPCGVASDEAVFEAPGVQVYYQQLPKHGGKRKETLIACVLPARTTVAVGTVTEYPPEKELEESEAFEVNGLLAGRYLWVSLVRDSESGSFAEERLLDLQTGSSVASKAYLEEAPDDIALALPGELVSVEQKGVDKLLAHLTATKTTTTLDTGKNIKALAAAEREIYWLDEDVVKSAADSAAPSEPAAPAPTASDAARRTPPDLAEDGLARAAKSNAKPKSNAKKKAGAAKRRCEAPGTTTLDRFESHLRVLQNPEGQVFGCSDAVGKLFALDAVLPGVTAAGSPTGIEFTRVNGLDSSLVLHYEFPAETSAGPATALVVVNPSSGKVIDSALAPADTTDWAYSAPYEAPKKDSIIAYTDGTSLTVAKSSGSRQVEEGTISELAVSPPDEEARGPFELYWTNGGVPKSLVIAK